MIWAVRAQCATMLRRLLVVGSAWPGPQPLARLTDLQAGLHVLMGVHKALAIGRWLC